MTRELVTTSRKTSPTLANVSPKQTRPRMVVVNFRIPESVKEAALERCEREGINLSDALRDFLTEWAAGE
jgi:predicted transcriptional regulator